ncbi:hypothetical protein BC629DRAFT_700552 [Irpex lacteus]|nr:hypothetical protein BC629DRAFT_700552 [Irpex lacteus]
MARAATKPRKYQCTRGSCSKMFTTKGDMNRHIRTVHDGIRDYVCKECGDCFGQRTSLQGHQSKHTGEKPYHCTVGGCNRRFGDASSRTRHAKEVHGSHYYTCIFPRCNKTTKRKSVMDKHLKKAHNVKGTAVDEITERSIRVKEEFLDSPLSSLTSLPDEESETGSSQDFVRAIESSSYSPSPSPSVSPRIGKFQCDFVQAYSLAESSFGAGYDTFYDPFLYPVTETLAYPGVQGAFSGTMDMVYGGTSRYADDYTYTSFNGHYSPASPSTLSPISISPSPSPGPLLCDTSSLSNMTSPSSELSYDYISSSPYSDWSQPTPSSSSSMVLVFMTFMF